MKKNRNCGGQMYPVFNQAVPMMGIPTPMMNPQPYSPSYSQTSINTYNNMEEQMNNIQQQINSLENRISKLESKTTTNNYTNKYNDSNYYML